MKHNGRSSSLTTLQEMLKHSFVKGVTWPVDRACLAALIDMGLSDFQIGAYFSVEPEDVHMLREKHGFIRVGQQ